MTTYKIYFNDNGTEKVLCEIDDQSPERAMFNASRNKKIDRKLITFAEVFRKPNPTRIKKIITANITIEKQSNDFSMDGFEISEDGLMKSTTYTSLVLKNTYNGKSEVVDLPKGKCSLDFIKDTELNDNSWIVFANDDIYREVSVEDRTERNIVLNKLQKIATDLSC